MTNERRAGYGSDGQDCSPSRAGIETSAKGSRHPNLIKLYYVPVFALRELLESRAPGQKFGHLRQAELVKQADGMAAITAADVDSLYENYRYGQPLTFYLYLLPGGLIDPDREELQSILDEVVAQERSDLLGGFCLCQGYECETCPHQITLLDEEELEGFHEIRFRYYVTHHFLNADEHPDAVLQSRYGFVWSDLSLGYLAILTHDERVNGLLTRALARCLRANPLPVCFPQELLDKHFSIEKAKHLSYYDPDTGIRRSISGHGLWQRFEQEIMSREQQYARPTSLYDEEVAQGVISGLGVASSKGKIYLTRTLPTSVVRAWARQRLPDLMRDVKELRAYQSDSPAHAIDAVHRMRLPSAGRTAINTIVEALLQTEREDLTNVGLSQTALAIYDALAGRYFSPYLRTLCSQCDQTAALCPYCESQTLDFGGQAVTCQACGATISDSAAVSLRCMNGHITTVPLAQAWSIAPNHWLQRRISRIFAEMERTWDERTDYFHIEGNTLYRLRKGTADRVPLPPVVQNYISNFWDPVTGQVHAGSGDIIAGHGHNGNNRQAGTSPAPVRAPGAAILVNEEKEMEGTMRKREDIRPTVTYTPTFYGPIYGPTHAGSGDIHAGGQRYGLEASDLTSLFEALRKLVAEQAPLDKKPAALQEVDELEAAVKAEKPDVGKMEQVLNWFRRYLPTLAGAVASVIVNPIVGRVVETAGELAAEELKRRFA